MFPTNHTGEIFMDYESLIKEAFTAAYQSEIKTIYANFSNNILFAKGNIDKIIEAENKFKSGMSHALDSYNRTLKLLTITY